MKKKVASLIIITIVLTLTVLFALQLKNLKLSGDFTALFPWAEITD